MVMAHKDTNGVVVQIVGSKSLPASFFPISWRMGGCITGVLVSVWTTLSGVCYRLELSCAAGYTQVASWMWTYQWSANHTQIIYH
jgi:hypothetical protein